MVLKKKDEKVEVLKGAEAENRILEYLVEQNRPYNATDLAANLKVIKKAEVTRCLTSLHENKKIEMKLFGKQQIFCCVQSASTVTSSEDLQKMQADLVNVKEQLKGLSDVKNALGSQLARLKCEPTTSQIPTVQEALRAQADNLREQLRVFKEANAEDNALQLKVEPKSKEELEKLDADVERYKALWLKRKKIGCQVINTITENIKDQEVRASFETQLGIESDAPALAQLAWNMLTANKTFQGRSHSRQSKKRTLSGRTRS